MRLLKAMIISLLLVGCESGSLFPSTSQRVNQIQYFKDSRTNLCFAYNSITNSNGLSWDVFTNVPCTPEVEKLISPK